MSGSEEQTLALPVLRLRTQWLIPLACLLLHDPRRCYFRRIERRPVRPPSAQPVYTEDSVEQLRVWRRNIAHKIDFYDELKEQSLAYRVCDGDDGLHMSSTQSRTFSLLQQYLGHDGTTGVLMSSVSLLSWYLTCSKEIATCLGIARCLWNLPAGEESVMNDLAGKYTLEQLSRSRLVFGLTICTVRVAIAILMLFSGTRFLVYTIELSRLLLQAVVLGFVMNIDELVFSSLAPAHVKHVMNELNVFKLPPMKLKTRNVRCLQNVDGRLVITVLVIVGSMCGAILGYMVPQGRTLIDVRNALCAGDREFVFALDGVGSVAWGYPTEVGYQEDIWWPWHVPWNEGHSVLSFPEHVLDLVLDGAGRVSDDECTAHVCYDPTSTIPIPLNRTRAPCCLAAQTNVPTISAGKFSIKEKSVETSVDATNM